MGRQHLELFGKTAQVAQRSTLKGQQATDIRKTAHQIKIEIRLEHRSGCIKVVEPAFIGINAQTILQYRHPLSHDDQGIRMQTIACLQKENPISSLFICQALIELLKTIATQRHLLHLHTGYRRHGNISRCQQPDLAWCIGLSSQAFQGNAQGQLTALCTPNHRDNSGPARPLVDAFWQHAQLSC
ncbi:hypothetical protein D3C85_845850 [compost metagenome]